MTIKQSYRPGYAARRMIHHSRVDFAVWLRNRQVEKAFHDPMLVTGKPSRLAAWMAKPYTPWLTGGLALLAAGGAVFLALHGRSGPGALAIPASVASAPAAPIAAPIAAPMAESSPAPAAAPETPAPQPATASLPAVPAPKSWALPEEYDMIVACKKDRTLYVYHHKGRDWKKTAAFPMAFGRKTGDKSDTGDLRTPEGRYWINGVFPGPVKGPLYGALVFTLNYPTPRDQADGKTGQGIWIHGVEEGHLPTFTHGCLSLANDDMVGLSAYAGVGTPVVILPDSLLPDPARQVDEAGMKSEYPALMASAAGNGNDTLAKAEAVKAARAFVAKETREHPGLYDVSLTAADKAAVLARLENWRATWCSRDAASYGSNYAFDFKDKDGRGRASFLDRKGKIFATKNRIEMTMDNAQVEAEGYGRVKVTFRQEYMAEGGDGVQKSSAMKTLRMEDGPTGWLIVSE